MSASERGDGDVGGAGAAEPILVSYSAVPSSLDEASTCCVT